MLKFTDSLPSQPPILAFIQKLCPLLCSVVLVYQSQKSLGKSENFSNVTYVINNFFSKHMVSVTHELRICFLEKRNMPWIKYLYSVSTRLWAFFWTSTRWRHHNTLNIKRKNGHVLPPMRQRWRGNIFTQYEPMIFTKQ